jgi:hypothetical protein
MNYRWVVDGMKLNIIVAAGAMALVAAALSAFVAYNYLYAGIGVPGTDLYIGKTVNTSELYHPEEFAWYTYNETENFAVTGEPSYDKQITFDFRDAVYNRSVSKRYRESSTYFNRSRTNLTQIVDTYWDASGTTYLSRHMEVLTNGTITYSSDTYDRGFGPYGKFLLAIPYGGYIIPRGTEKVTIGGTTYDCRKYYLPDQKHGNTFEIMQHTFWFADSIPVPVKIHFSHNVTYELACWG